MIDAIVVLSVCAIFLAAFPIAAGALQFLLSGISFFSTHLEETDVRTPRLAILIPAWNEDQVIAKTIETLLESNYPREALRIYVIDDASSDQTPDLVVKYSKLHPGVVYHLRRVAGGEGKAHTLNYGLKMLWRDDWTETVLIMDADVLYEKNALRQMARHFRDPSVGAVTAYIKEGSRDPNYVQEYVTFEYITATGASRRAQNVLGFLACLSGGAQMHTRENLLAIGGEIFHDTLAEDTFTTFLTQLNGRKAIFEPNAIVYAEEPDTIEGLWKQRIRWARGNVQITSVFRQLWCNRRKHRYLGSVSMAMLWFSIFLMPVLQIGATVGLLTLYVVDEPLAWTAFNAFWIVSAIVYLFVTGVSLLIDRESARKSWKAGFMFPGAISFSIIVYALAPFLFEPVFEMARNLPDFVTDGFVLFLYAWVSLSMVVSYAAKQFETHGYPRIARWCLHVGGYGSFLCAVTFGAYIKELRGESKVWDKTVKTGKVG